MKELKKKRNVRNMLLEKLSHIFSLIIITIPFAAIWFAYYDGEFDRMDDFGHRMHLLVIVLYVVIYSLMVSTYHTNLHSMSDLRELVFHQVITVMMTNGIMYFVMVLLFREFTRPWWLIAVFALQVVLTSAWLWVAQRFKVRMYPPKRTALIYGDVDEKDLFALISSAKLSYDFKLVRKMTASEFEAHEADFKQLTRGLDSVVVADVDRQIRNRIIGYCRQSGLDVYISPTLTDVVVANSVPRHMMYKLFYQIDRFKPTMEYLFVKRLMDIVVSLVALVLLSPLMLATAIAIKATDHGPVFYKQTRLTIDGKEYKIYKFRSMRTDAEKDGKARLSSGVNDDRITPVGHIIRKFRIDELPQLLNVLKGDMSLVGPRPERPEIAREYEKTLPEFSLRLEVKAGLTGYAQVFGKYNTTPEEKLQLDLIYIGHPSLFSDLRILLQTVKVLFTPESTEGVAENQVTAMRP